MKSHIQYSATQGLYVATLLGGEFDNVYGHGKTVKEAEISLKIRYNQLKRLKGLDKSSR